MIIITHYKCEFCKTPYATADLAQLCEAQSDKTRDRVGEIVLAKSGFGWFDGERSWGSNLDVRLKTLGARCPKGDDNCFASCRNRGCKAQIASSG
jgi:hypothetical protein